MIRRNIAALGRGDIEPLLAGYHDDAVLVFPGTSSWGGEHRGKAAIEAFLRRFLAAGLRGEAQDIVVNGPPWRTTVCILFTDEARGDDGEVVYENRAVLFGRVVWGKIVYQEDFEDTHKVEAFDDHLSQAGRAPA
jgi:ketosteroid isomerase-like protein